MGGPVGQHPSGFRFRNRIRPEFSVPTPPKNPFESDEAPVDTSKETEKWIRPSITDDTPVAASSNAPGDADTGAPEKYAEEQKVRAEDDSVDTGATTHVWHDDRPRKLEPKGRDFIPLFESPRAPVWRSWLLILLSAATLIVITALFSRQDPVLRDHIESDNVAIQSRQAATLMGVEAEYNVLTQMRELATTPNATRRVATTWAALDRGDGTRTLIALSLMSRINKQVEDGAPLAAPKDLDPLLIRAFMYPLDLTDQEHEYIEANIGWPAKLLFARDLPDQHPVKTKLYNEASTINTWASVVVLIALLLGALGLVLLTRFWAEVRRKDVLFELPKGVAQGDIYLEAGAVYLAAFAIGRVLLHVGGESAAWMGILAQIGGTIVAIFWPALRGVPTRAMLHDLGVHTGAGVWTELRAGIVGYCAVLPFFAGGVLVMFTLQYAFSKFGVDVSTPAHPDMVGLGEISIQKRILLLAVAGVFAPITEELMFRGALFRGLRARWSFWPSAIVLAVIFAAIHPQGALAIPPLAALAVGFAGLREWRDSLIAPTLAHAIHNSTLVILLSVLLH